MIAAIETSESGSILKMRHSRAALIHFLLIAATVMGFHSMSVADSLTLIDGTVMKADIITDTPTEVTMNCKVGGKYEMKKFARAKFKSVVDDAPKVSGSGAPKTPPDSGDATSGGTVSKEPPSGAGADPAPSNPAGLAIGDIVVVDGQSLYARIKTMQKARASAIEIFQTVFEGFPTNVLKYEIAEGPTQVTLSDAAAATAEGEAIVLVKVDIEIDKEKYSAWCKGAKEAFSTIATERMTVRWNPSQGGAKKIATSSGGSMQSGYLGDDFLQAFKGFMTEKSAKAEHLILQGYGEQAKQTSVGSVVLLTKQLVAKASSDTSGKATKGDDSLRAPLAKNNLGFFCVCLLSSASGQTVAFDIPREFVETIAEIGSAPQISVGLVDAEGKSFGSAIHPKMDPVPFVQGKSQATAMLAGPNSSCWEAKPVFLLTLPRSLGGKNRGPTGFRGGGLEGQSNCGDGCLICPYLLGTTARDVVFSARISIPFWFSIALKDLPNCKKVDVKLGKRASIEH